MAITNTEITQPEAAETVADTSIQTATRNVEEKGSLGTTIVRLALGFTTLFTWFDNVSKDFYDGANFPGFFNDYLFVSQENGGNGSSLFFVQDILNATILQAPEFFGWVLTIFELAIALGLIFGVFTRAVALGAIAFFFNLFLVYFGGSEWIWTYVLLVASAVTIFFNWGGRFLGVDQFIAKARGESPLGLIW